MEGTGSGCEASGREDFGEGQRREALLWPVDLLPVLLSMLNNILQGSGIYSMLVI